MQRLPSWVAAGSELPISMHKELSKGPETAKLTAKISGAMLGLQDRVDGYLRTFEPFAFLWLKDLASEYTVFLDTKPELEVEALILVLLI